MVRALFSFIIVGGLSIPACGQTPLVPFTLSGQTYLSGLPASLLPGADESDLGGAVFLEDRSKTLNADLRVDAVRPGIYNTQASLLSGYIPSGTTVSSTFLSLDPVESTGTPFSGSITFNSDILGVIALTSTLNATDGIFGASGVSYPATAHARGFEFLPGEDGFTISENLRTLTFSAMTWDSVDELRIITAAPGVIRTASVSATPEPGSIVLLTLGVAGVAFLRRKIRS